MTEPMAYGARRFLTPGEERALSPGLQGALIAAGATPQIIARPALGARLAQLWRGSAPIMVWYDGVYWPEAAADFSESAHAMALVQHELQHVLEFRTGALGPLRYGLLPRNWRYAYQAWPDAQWRWYGAEQRAQIVQDLWLAEQGLLPAAAPLDWYRRLIPWAEEP